LSGALLEQWIIGCIQLKTAILNFSFLNSQFLRN
jgi:hypothetical protein